MIPLVDVSWQGQPWQWQLANGIAGTHELGSLLDLRLDDVPADFPMLVPRPFVARMTPGDYHDPLLLQVLPTAIEGETPAGYVTDPVGDLSAQRQPGLLQKYEGRVLVIATGACAINCRYCFRRHFPYTDVQPNVSEWESIIQTVGQDDSINEVILSGGDPLVLSDRRLASLVASIDAIDHVDTIRLHTRLPVVVPNRVCDAMTEWISTTRSRIVVVIHSNHPNEIDESVATAMTTLKDHGVTLLNQSVLLAGINDDARILIRLSRQLFSVGVLPYYLHALDPVAGAAHFDVPDNRARSLIDDMRASLPGYLVPRLVREIEGTASKVPLS